MLLTDCTALLHGPVPSPNTQEGLFPRYLCCGKGMKLGYFQHPYQFPFRKSGPNLLKMRETQAISLEIRLPKTGMSRERLRKLLSIGRLMLALVETERTEIVMEEMA